MKLLKTMSLAWQFAKIQVMERTENLIAFSFWIIGLLIQIIITLVFFKALYLQVDEIGGWNINQLLILLGTFYLLRAISWAFYQRGFWDLPGLIEYGYLDRFLSKPISTKKLVSIHKTEFFLTLPEFLIAVGMIFYGAVNITGNPNLLGYLFVVICAVIIDYSLVVIFGSLNFFFIFQRTYWILGELMDLGKYPISIYKGAVKVFFSIVLPLAIMFTFPARAMVGDLSIFEFIFSGAWAILFYLLSDMIWKSGLKNYESANG